MSKKKDQMVYIVEDCEMSPGKILAVFNNFDDAELFATMYFANSSSNAWVMTYKLWHGQPDVCGVNK